MCLLCAFLSLHVVCYRKSLHHATPKWVVLQWDWPDHDSWVHQNKSVAAYAALQVDSLKCQVAFFFCTTPSRWWMVNPSLLPPHIFWYVMPAVSGTGPTIASAKHCLLLDLIGLLEFLSFRNSVLQDFRSTNASKVGTTVKRWFWLLLCVALNCLIMVLLPDST